MSDSKPNYLILKDHYEDCLSKFGETHKGVDWPTEESMRLRYSVMESLLPSNRACHILDLGCGLGAFKNFLHDKGQNSKVKYTGFDISPEFIRRCKKNFPTDDFRCVDILNQQINEKFDYVVANGVFTVKKNLTDQAMVEFLEKMLIAVSKMTNESFIFNVMSDLVDFKNPDLFYVSMDKMASILAKTFSRHFRIIHDYGLYEYSVVVSHKPLQPAQ